jgi:hypothetical protein
MRELADALELKVVPVPAGSMPQLVEETAESIAIGGPSFHEEDQPMEDTEQTTGPDL